MALYIHVGKVLWRRGRMIQVADGSHIFDCPVEECEYIMTARTEDEAISLRDAHMLINHPVDLASLRWEEAFETEVPDYVDRVFGKIKEETLDA